jgi:protein ImuB
LKLLQLHLERHPPGAAIIGFQVALQSTPPKRLQKDLFLPATPQPDTLELTLARIRGLVGKENVSTPYPLDTHRFDAFRHGPFCVEEGVPVQPANGTGREEPAILRLAMRIFRPALQARVQVRQSAPKIVVAPRVQGTVVRSAGPWKTCGEWWADTAWAREEWDVALDDGGLYRIYQESSTRAWFVEGIYD